MVIFSAFFPFLAPLLPWKRCFGKSHQKPQNIPTFNLFLIFILLFLEPVVNESQMSKGSSEDSVVNLSTCGESSSQTSSRAAAMARFGRRSSKGQPALLKVQVVEGSDVLELESSSRAIKSVKMINSNFGFSSSFSIF